MKKPKTPRSMVRSALKRLFLRSREHLEALRRDKYTCQDCGKKRSAAKGREQKVEVHHIEGICNWEAVIDIIFARILCSPEFLKTMCPECHQKETEKQKRNSVA